jgi:hypothetical protein
VRVVTLDLTTGQKGHFKICGHYRTGGTYARIVGAILGAGCASAGKGLFFPGVVRGGSPSGMVSADGLAMVTPVGWPARSTTKVRGVRSLRALINEGEYPSRAARVLITYTLI